jgi:hypothetical protein
MSVGGPRRKLLAVALVAGATLLPAVIGGNLALAQTPAQTSPEIAINLGGRGWSSPSSNVDETKRSADQFSFEARGGFATDYMYRGTTLSDHKPAVGAAFEAAFSMFYAGVAVASVKLPTQPSAEISASAGLRKTIADINFDLGATYFLYPGETAVAGAEGIDYWEAAFRADKRIAEFILSRGVLLTRQTSPIPAPGALTPRVAWASRCRLGFSHWTLPYRSPAEEAIPGSAIIAAVRWFCLARLSELAVWRDVHAQGFQSGSALLRHQSLAGKLFRPDRRS